MGDIQQSWQTVPIDGKPQMGIVSAVLKVPERDCRPLLKDQWVTTVCEPVLAVQVDARHTGEVVRLVERHCRITVGVLSREVVTRHRIGAGQRPEDRVQYSALDYG